MRHIRRLIRAFGVLAILPLNSSVAIGSVHASSAADVTVCDATWHDAARSRDLPVRIRIPDGKGPFPVILFSHGLGGTVDAGTTWAEAWSKAGFAVIHLQHPGSDQSLWIHTRGAADRLAALRSGMTGEQLLARVGDVRFVLDELKHPPHAGACDLSRLDLSRIGMAGHSFGAVTTQAVAGETLGGTRGVSLGDPRIKAAIAFSPSPPKQGAGTASSAFATVGIPFFSITGTEDAVPVLNGVTPEQRTVPFRSMPAGQKYLLVMAGGTHADFSGNPRPPGNGPRSQVATGGRARTRLRTGTQDRGGNEHIQQVVIAATTAFWKSTLLGDAEARAFLEKGGLKYTLAAEDRFEWR